MLGCGGGGDGLVIFGLEASRLKEAVALLSGGGISGGAVLLELDVASNGCRDAGRLAILEALGAGVAEALLDSPQVIRINSLKMPSSLYDNCIGLQGFE